MWINKYFIRIAVGRDHTTSWGHPFSLLHACFTTCLFLSVLLKARLKSESGLMWMTPAEMLTLGDILKCLPSPNAECAGLLPSWSRHEIHFDFAVPRHDSKFHHPLLWGTAGCSFKVGEISGWLKEGGDHNYTPFQWHLWKSDCKQRNERDAWKLPYLQDRPKNTCPACRFESASQSAVCQSFPAGLGIICNVLSCKYLVICVSRVKSPALSRANMLPSLEGRKPAKSTGEFAFWGHHPHLEFG